jgi:hypothetical protein
MGTLVWLASYPKSGNTWMRAFLHNLFRDPSQPMNINQLAGSLSQGESSLGWYRLIDTRPVSEWTQEDVSRMRPKVHKLIAQGQQGSIFCKTHNALVTVRGHPTVNQQVSGGAIYIVRNPLDVVLSFADFQGVSVDIAIKIMATPNFETPIGERNTSEILGSWSQHVESWTAKPNPQLHVVRYEDLIASPTKTFGGVTTFLGLKTPRERLERAIKNSSFKVLQNQEQKFGFAERPAHQEKFFRKGTSGQWKKELSAEQVAAICEAHREQMARFDYLPEGR